ncbi:heme A synthase [Camelliibacillus cellulosilyticus]|uniref:Heme A synthase n=1 Tax=Camelliibacillus cellulosilyticus TaxID=2174486 RepID=A0ABV9GR99_9BACL
MIQKQGHRLFPMALLTAVGLFIIILMGFIDTLTTSTMGCGKQWPLCQGGWIPSDWNFHAFVEYAHRFVVMLIVMVMTITYVLTWRRFTGSKKVKGLITLAVAAVMIEAGLGASSVLLENPPFILAFHMGVSLTAFTAATLLAAVVHQLEKDQQQSPPPFERTRQFKRLSMLTLVLAFVAIYFGAYVTHSGHGSQFRGWLIPSETVGQGLLLDLIHRGLAFGLCVCVITLAAQSFRIRRFRHDLFSASVCALLCIFLQIVCGFFMILTHAAPIVFLAHISFASLLFAAIAYLVLQSMDLNRQHNVSRHGGLH